jgi:hypothetical protein
MSDTNRALAAWMQLSDLPCAELFFVAPAKSSPKLLSEKESFREPCTYMFCARLQQDTRVPAPSASRMIASEKSQIDGVVVQVAVQLLELKDRDVSLQFL